MLFDQSNPKWKRLLYAVQGKELDMLIDYDQLDQLTGLDIRNKDRGVVYKVNKVLLETSRRMLVNVKGEGYKLALPHDQSRHGQFRRIRARRQADKGIRELVFMDTSAMSADEKVRLTHMINHLSTAQAILRHKQLESLRLTQEVVRGQRDSLSDIDDIQQALDDLKRRLGEESN